MPFPTNIKKEDLLKAIEEIDNSGVPNGAASRHYDVDYNDKRYPPKLIVSIANKFANGEILNRDSFGGGENTQSFKLLEQNGFKIIKKATTSFYPELKMFVDQAERKDLKTSHYSKIYENLQVKVSFGAGNQAQIPWIAFLTGNQTVQNGIYPVYLYYKAENLLILAYGVSETSKSSTQWDLENPVSIEDYFLKNRLGKPKRYGDSLVFKAYKTSDLINQSELDEDLNTIIRIYKMKIGNSIDLKPSPTHEKFLWRSFYNKSSNINFQIEQKLCIRFIAALLTKPFVILTGLSGSGKTRLAQAFAMWLCEDASQYCLIAVAADWSNREPLLGFTNGLRPKEYVVPENKVLDLIIEANRNTLKPYFLILDEMNLSHVERYFADFLSAMESSQAICLHPGNEDWNGVPAEIKLPKNLFIIGTVNIDETTYMFSPKVLDRANVIEFKVNISEMENYLQKNAPLNLTAIKSSGSTMANDFIQIQSTNNFITKDTDILKSVLIDFFKELKKTGSEFGYRSAAEILRFANIINQIEESWSMNEIIDCAILQKLLPKVHGSRRKLEPVLKSLGSLCLTGSESIESLINARNEIEYSNMAKVKFPLSLEKILRMYYNLISNGFTSYAEA